MSGPTREQIAEWLEIHDFDDPMSWLNALELAPAMVRHMRDACEFCQPTWTPLPMPGNAWGAEVTHAPECPVTLELEL